MIPLSSALETLTGDSRSSYFMTGYHDTVAKLYLIMNDRRKNQ